MHDQALGFAFETSLLVTRSVENQFLQCMHVLSSVYDQLLTKPVSIG